MQTLPTNIVNCEKSSRGVWLVKVPRYLSELWEKNAGSDVGRLVTGLGDTGRNVVFRSTSSIASSSNLPENKPETPNITNHSNISNVTSKNFRSIGDLHPLGKQSNVSIEIPTEHQFIIRDLSNQTMVVLCEDKSGMEDETQFNSGKLSVEGRVVKRAECQPPNSSAYMRMKIRQIEINRQPKKYIKQMERAVVSYKPVSVHSEHLSKTKKDIPKYIRGDKNEVMQAIFQAFEKHQYYRLADLQRLTNQPANFIREILFDIGSYNTAPPHKSMWELKPEYCNYKAGNSSNN